MTAAPFNIVAIRMSCPGQSTNDTCLNVVIRHKLKLTLTLLGWTKTTYYFTLSNTSLKKTLTQTRVYCHENIYNYIQLSGQKRDIYHIKLTGLIEIFLCTPFFHKELYPRGHFQQSDNNLALDRRDCYICRSDKIHVRIKKKNTKKYLKSYFSKNCD